MQLLLELTCLICANGLQHSFFKEINLRDIMGLNWALWICHMPYAECPPASSCLSHKEISVKCLSEIIYRWFEICSSVARLYSIQLQCRKVTQNNNIGDKRRNGIGIAILYSKSYKDDRTVYYATNDPLPWQVAQKRTNGWLVRWMNGWMDKPSTVTKSCSHLKSVYSPLFLCYFTPSSIHSKSVKCPVDKIWLKLQLFSICEYHLKMSCLEIPRIQISSHDLVGRCWKII